MSKTTTTIQDRTAVRAYYLWLDGRAGGAEAHWLEAEQIEKAYAERRAASAKKAAATRKAKVRVPVAAMAARSPRSVPLVRQ